MAAHDDAVAERMARLDEDHQRRLLPRRRVGLLVGTVVLSALMAVAVLDGLDVVDSVGVDRAEVEASRDGTTLTVSYPEVSRPALASPFEIVITREGGFGGEPVEVTVTADYLGIWDFNGLVPAPSEETATGTDVHWTFDPPDGDVLRVVYDGRIEPAAQDGEPGSVAVLDDDGSVLVGVSFTTVLRP